MNYDFLEYLLVVEQCKSFFVARFPGRNRQYMLKCSECKVYECQHINTNLGCFKGVLGSLQEIQFKNVPCNILVAFSNLGTPG